MELEFIEERTLCRGRRIELVQRIYRFDGDFLVKDVVKFGQSVAIVPVKSGRTIVLIKQFRAPVGRWVVEVPAGRIELGEPPENAVVRELREEIGYEPKYIKKLVSIYLSPGYSDEVIHIYLAKDLKYVGSSPEKGELIVVFEVDLDKALELVLQSDIIDAKTLIALLIARDYI